jgi:hypothetical protein
MGKTELAPAACLLGEGALARVFRASCFCIKFGKLGAIIHEDSDRLDFLEEEK